MREKLIELYCEVEQLRNLRLGVGECVDILIANGVAIPVRCEECMNFEIKCDCCECRLSLSTVKPSDFCSYGQRKAVSLEDVVNLEAQTKANNDAMRKVIDFIVE